jgi:predicted double-glycine peptidase
VAQFLFTLLTTMLLSEEEARFSYVYKQGYDTSCGIAVTASMLHTYWNIPVQEPDLYQEMILDRLETEDVTYTISFLDIMDSLKRYTVQSRAYKMDWDALVDSLEKGYSPIIINYENPKPHFALLLHIENGYAFVADPARGFELVDSTVFNRNYSGNAILTASQAVSKNSALIQTITADEKNRLDTLQRTAKMRRRM